MLKKRNLIFLSLLILGVFLITGCWLISTPTYTVTYDGNSSTGGNVPNDSTEYKENDTVTVLDKGDLVNTGYAFAGWNTQADGSGAVQTEGSTFTMGAADVTLYAQWTINTYTVNFDSQGGSAVAPQTVEHGGLATEPTAPRWTGHTFGGWYKESECTNPWNFVTDTVTFDVTLYAQWTINTYTVTYDSQDGSAVSSQRVKFGRKAAEPEDPTKTGYTFGGWYKESGCVNPWDFDTDRVGSDVTLYAQWTINTYTVTFDSQGGSAVAPQTVEYGGKVTKPKNPTRTGYTFGGWYKESGCINAWAFATDTVIADVTLYAKWTINTYTVTYNGNGSTGGTAPTDSSSPYDYGATVTVLGNTGNLVKTGYTFDGWNTAANGSDTDQAEGSTFTMGTSNVTLYAKWNINSYTVNFDSHDGSAVASQTVDYGGKVTKPTNPTRTGYTFGGWYKESECTNAWAFATDTVTADVTLYAKWTINTYTVTFNSHDGSAVASQTVDYGGKVTKPTNPTLTNYTFSGWYKESTYNNLWVFANDTVISDITLHAKWTCDTSYALRGTGPAGGWIFYDNGCYSDVWKGQYLEATLSDQSTGIQWYNGSYVITGATGTAIGTGQANTTAIVDIQGAGNYAAQLCNDLTEGGYSDWFLPSKDELNLMRENLKLFGVGGFADSFYWSSSEYDVYSAWIQDFSDGFQYSGSDKPNTFWVRPVRAF